MSLHIPVELKNHPEIKAIIRAAEPSYKRREAVIVVQAAVTLTDTYWDGGSRSIYTAVNMLTRRSAGAPQYDPPQFGGPKETPVVTLPENIAIVRTGTMCGKTARAYVYVHPSNLAKLLPDIYRNFFNCY